VDETYVKVNGVWRYVYRAIDQDGQVIDVLVSARRDADSARRFFRRALTMLKGTPVEVVRMRPRLRTRRGYTHYQTSRCRVDSTGHGDLTRPRFRSSASHDARARWSRPAVANQDHDTGEDQAGQDSGERQQITRPRRRDPRCSVDSPPGPRPPRPSPSCSSATFRCRCGRGR
jgi:hypothetical protein